MSQHTQIRAKRQDGAQSIRRTLSILRSVSRFNEKGVRLSTVAKDVSLPVPTVHRILSVLLEENFLTFSRESKLYHLGSSFYTLSSVTRQYSLRDRYHACLKRISDFTEDTAYLLIRSGYDGLCIDRVMGSYRVQVLGYEIGESRVLGVGAAGQALLAFLPEVMRDEVLAANSARYVKHFGIHPDDIRDAVEQTRTRGYALSYQRVTSDSVGVGAPILNQAGQVTAAVSLSGITSRMNAERCVEIARFIMDEIEAVTPLPA